MFRHGILRVSTWVYCGMNTLTTLWYYEVLIRELLSSNTSLLWCFKRAIQYIGMDRPRKQLCFTSLTSTSMFLLMLHFGFRRIVCCSSQKIVTDEFSSIQESQGKYIFHLTFAVKSHGLLQTKQRRSENSEQKD